MAKQLSAAFTDSSVKNSAESQLLAGTTRKSLTGVASILSMPHIFHQEAVLILQTILF